MAALSMADLRAKTDEFKARLAKGETLDDNSGKAFGGFAYDRKGLR